MPSPFPGMDPYLEAHWGDVHRRLIGYACDAMQECLPRDLLARMEERIYVETPEERATRFPDIRIVETRPPFAEGGVAIAEPVAVAEPYLLDMEAQSRKQGYIEIREPESERVVTVIEVLSPANKRSGDGRKQYLRKQRELERGGVSFVEIDLLRAGKWTVWSKEHLIPIEKRLPYRINVWRSWRPNRIEFYHAPLRQRLPVIPIPLRESDDDLPLDLQLLIDRAYRFGRYETTDYSTTPDPSFNEDDAKWADDVLQSAGLRSNKE